MGRLEHVKLSYVELNEYTVQIESCFILKTGCSYTRLPVFAVNFRLALACSQGLNWVGAPEQFMFQIRDQLSESTAC